MTTPRCTARGADRCGRSEDARLEQREVLVRGAGHRRGRGASARGRSGAGQRVVVVRLIRRHRPVGVCCGDDERIRRLPFHEEIELHDEPLRKALTSELQQRRVLIGKRAGDRAPRVSC